MVSGQRSARPSKPGGKPDAILRAAWKLIRHYGYTKTTIAEVAHEAGVGKGTVYLYFRSKEEIMLALVDWTNERINDELRRIAQSDLPPEERVRRCLMHRVLTIYDLVHRYPHGEDVISSMKPAIARRIDRHVRDQGEILAGILDQAPAGAAHLLAELFELLTPPYYRFRTRRSLEEFASKVADLVLAGLAEPALTQARRERS
ncbi:MAG: TetR/AcrR family transcriptional regulator [Planctomycetota bacterium]|jgi:AcrR family transcriptional regulator